MAVQSIIVGLTPAQQAAVEIAIEVLIDAVGESRWRKCFIAGGFYRDIATGRDYKDIDIFIPGDCQDNGNTIDVEYDLMNTPVVTRDGVQVNLIWMVQNLDLESTMRRMDFAICQIGATAEEPFAVVCTEQFEQDLLSETLTLTRVTRDERIERITDKFPGWDIKYPEYC